VNFVSILRALWPVLLWLLAAPLARAQEPEPELCWKIENDALRLACYDRQGRTEEDRPVDPRLGYWQQRYPESHDSVYSLLNYRWELTDNLGKFILRPYKPVYFLPLFYSNNPNPLPDSGNPRTTVTSPLDLDYSEAKLQLSFKTKLEDNLLGENIDLWFGFTQSSHWQIYNSNASRPFRETNYEPELMLVHAMNFRLGSYTARMVSLSFNHQSNGRSEPLSRSWNRVILTLGFDRPDWAFLLRPWWRLPETSADEDENPDILDYVGRGEVLVVHRKGNSHQIAALVRHSLKDGSDSRGSVRIDWSYPCFNRLRCHLQVFSGYGESLIDFNHRTTAIGIGMALLEWF